MLTEIQRNAFIDGTGNYRYLLTRSWAPLLPRCCFVMFNPSTADGLVDDPTIRRCIGFAQRWGYGGLDVVNLFAWRCPFPAFVRLADEPVGPCNDLQLREAVTHKDTRLVVVAWGCGGGDFPERVNRFRAHLVAAGNFL